MAQPAQRMSLQVPKWIAIGTVCSCALVWMARGVYVYWDDIKIVNFLAAWIPFVLSILIAFVPEHEMSAIKKILWRSSVIIVGFAWSVVLWHQQVIADKAARDDQRNIVNEAVTQSNQHSDAKIGEVQRDVRGVETDVLGVKNAISQSTSSLNESIGKVSKPEPVERTKMVFTLWTDDVTIMPVLAETLIPDKDAGYDIYTVNISFTNVASTPASGLDVWIAICTLCEFVEEMSGFESLKGMNKEMRHKVIPQFNPGAMFEKTTIKLKIKQSNYAAFKISFRYSCSTCGKLPEEQNVTITKGTPTPFITPLFRPSQVLYIPGSQSE